MLPGCVLGLGDEKFNLKQVPLHPSPVHRYDGVVTPAQRPGRPLPIPPSELYEPSPPGSSPPLRGSCHAMPSSPKFLGGSASLEGAPGSPDGPKRSSFSSSCKDSESNKRRQVLRAGGWAATGTDQPARPWSPLQHPHCIPHACVRASDCLLIDRGM